MARPPSKPSDKVSRPGIKGFILDRIDHIKLAFRNYIKEADERRRKLANVGKDDFGNDIQYETRKKGRADKKAKAAGKVEKLK